MSPVIVTAVFHPRPGFRDKVEAAIQASLPQVHAEPGCLLYALHEADDQSLALVEKWASREALGSHASGAAVAQLNQALDGLLEQEPAIATMTPLPGGQEQQGQL